MSTMTIFTGMKAVAVTAAISLLVLTATDADGTPAPPHARSRGPERFDLDAGGCRWSELLRPCRGDAGCVARTETESYQGGEDGRGGAVQDVSGGATTGHFEVVVAAAGYVPRHIGSGLGMTSVRARLEQAEAIGGVVRDEQGRPIEGARVFPMASPFATVWPEMYTSPNGGLASATTDAQGLWRAEALPAGTDPMKFSVLVTHGDHVTGEFSTIARGPCVGERAGHEVGRVDLRDGTEPVRPPGVGRGGGGREAAVGRGALRLRTDKDGRFRSSSCIDPGVPGWSCWSRLRASPGPCTMSP